MSKHFRVEAALAPGMPVPVDAHRFVRVLRARAGDAFTVCDGGGRLWSARVASLDPFALIVIAAAAAPDRDPVGELEVWVPLLKGGKTDDLVRQLTELGATRVVPFTSRCSVVRLDAARARERHARFVAIAREAGNQCGRTQLPEVMPPVDGIPRAPDAARASAFLYEGGGASLAEVLGPDGGRPARVTRILTGPEGGLAPDEAAALVAAGWRATTLGARILRAETAAVAFATLALAALGEL